MSTQALIEDKISQIQKYLNILRAYQGRGKSDIQQDVTLRGAVERYLYLLTQAVIDLAEMLIAYKKLRKPATMSECFEILGEAKLIEPDLQETMIKLTGFRNVLAHDYTDIDYDIVHDVLNNKIADVEKFVRRTQVS